VGPVAATGRRNAHGRGGRHSAPGRRRPARRLRVPGDTRGPVPPAWT
jgi:hypothetical protein